MMRLVLRQCLRSIRCALRGHRWTAESAATVAIWPNLAGVNYCRRCYGSTPTDNEDRTREESA